MKSYSSSRRACGSRVCGAEHLHAALCEGYPIYHHQPSVMVYGSCAHVYRGGAPSAIKQIIFAARPGPKQPTHPPQWLADESAKNIGSFYNNVADNEGLFAPLVRKGGGEFSWLTDRARDGAASLDKYQVKSAIGRKLFVSTGSDWNNCLALWNSGIEQVTTIGAVEQIQSMTDHHHEL